ncbi:RidA family protein [Spirosoma utsteinense]|uniref:2-iminobutanoate/2-iminopropanoate deaminase n=2 Tax=Spirosoma utsteinense TaxID=2585773 RepID=A0ABR6W108_9BACT|nr:RidA family protein [Spirosoma utsteinense]MBC3783639.1 2-iminobutanoate/2-iminopropanoate deaminase [Spirosoma utsteinense]MBC3790218.1 2-iminobutanoate/2-iminopropanoate deaminase [Spirosoma utsteinense]
MTFIETPNAPVPGGHYSQAVVHNGLVYLSGILPITPAGEKLNDATVVQQTEQILANLDAILDEAGSQRDKVLKVSIFIADITAWSAVNQVYAQFFGDHRPARSVVPCSTLHYGFGIELEAVAAV